MELTARDRCTGLDALRVLATVAVVVMHVSANPLRSTDSQSWWIANLAVSFSQWGVPVFVMISGALLLSPARQEPPSRFLLRRARRILPPLVFWSAVYFAAEWARGQEIGARKILGTVLSGGPSYHLYFLYLIGGLYLVTPALRTYVANATRRDERGLIAVVMLLVLAHGTFRFLETERSAPAFALTWFVPFIGYYLSGNYLFAGGDAPRRPWVAGAAATLSVLCVAAGSWLLIAKYGMSARGYYFRNYRSLPEIVLALSVFTLATGPLSRCGSLAGRAAPLTFGIYLCHPLVLTGLGKAGLNGLWHGAAIGIPATSALALLASACIVWIMQRVPILRLAV